MLPKIEYHFLLTLYVAFQNGSVHSDHEDINHVRSLVCALVCTLVYNMFVQSCPLKYSTSHIGFKLQDQGADHSLLF